MIERLTRALACAALGAGLLAVAGLAAAPAQAATAKAPATQLSPDDPAYPLTRPNPEAEIGKLPNGLTYGVMRRAGTRRCRSS